MKIVFAFLLVLAVQNSFAQTCLNYFKSRASIKEVLESDNVRISLLRQNMELLRNQRGLLLSIDKQDFFREILNKKMSDLQPQMSHLNVLISNLRKVLDERQGEISHLSEQKSRLQERERALSKNAGRIAQMGQFFHRLLVSKAAAEKSADMMEKSIAELKHLRSKLKVIKDLEKKSIQSFNKYDEPTVLAQIMQYEEIIARMKEDAYIESAYEAEQKISEVKNGADHVMSEIEVLSHVFAKEWLLLQNDLYSMSHANQELLSRKVCQASQCETVGRDMLSILDFIIKSVDELRLAKKYVLSRDRFLGFGFDLRKVINNAADDVTYLDHLRMQEDFQAFEDAIIDEVETIIQSRKTIFTSKDQLIQRLYDFRLHLNKMVIDGDSLLSQQNLDFKTAKNDFSDLEIVILSLIDRLEKLQSIKDISLKQYESLRSLAVQSSVQLERLLKAQQFVSARLATLAQGDKPWEQELEALRIEILEEFAGNSESR